MGGELVIWLSRGFNHAALHFCSLSTRVGERVEHIKFFALEILSFVLHFASINSDLVCKLSSLELLSCLMLKCSTSLRTTNDSCSALMTLSLFDISDPLDVLNATFMYFLYTVFSNIEVQSAHWSFYDGTFFHKLVYVCFACCEWRRKLRFLFAFVQ